MSTATKTLPARAGGAHRDKKRTIKTLALLTLLLALLALANYAAPVISRGVRSFEAVSSPAAVEALVTDIRADGDYVAFEDISAEFLASLVAHEDKRFYIHPGFDPIAIVRAFLVNVKNGRVVQGGSTITQQLAKNMFYIGEDGVERKIAELLTAVELEAMYGKQTILELYCNIVYFGEGCFGLREAAEHYYGVEPADLSKAQADALVISLPAPDYYNPNALAA